LIHIEILTLFNVDLINDFCVTNVVDPKT